MAAIQITENEFEEVVLKSDKPVLVDFWASWCGPCRMLKPVVDGLSESQDKVKVVGVDADGAERLCIQYGISNIPCLILFKDGEEADRHVGFATKSQLEAFIGL